MTGRDLEAAERSARYWEERVPDDPVWSDLLGSVLLEMDRTDEAMGFLRRAIELEPGYLQPRIRLVNVLIAERRYAEAEAMIARGLRLSGFYPQVPNAIYQLAWLRLERGEADLAARTVRVAIARLSHLPATRENVALREQAEALLAKARASGR
jgi:tetratricopeptide (TPR) repeat protein